MIQWEYAVRAHNHDVYASPTTHEMIAEQSLNALGEQGWELVSVIHKDHDDGHITRHQLIMIFKRPKEGSYR